ncbi:hypothetical protein D1115_22730 (plasmid) [Vibrio alfacsensis]|uniref:Uncharacterized protein n=1 Tax=Vibrio alfacsensis TaxID=1074311 RepID=A0ABM6Z0V2_9VIBR|nr:hypothetical protein [Vibrio alfacsensis]AXY03699.1 hypothetical protein D1115_22730 [Vibrio alfacsensis]
MRVNITLNQQALHQQGIDDQELVEYIQSLGLVVTNAKMLIRFKVFTTDIDDEKLQLLGENPIVLDISPDTRRHAI